MAFNGCLEVSREPSLLHFKSNLGYDELLALLIPLGFTLAVSYKSAWLRCMTDGDVVFAPKTDVGTGLDRIKRCVVLIIVHRVIIDVHVETYLEIVRWLIITRFQFSGANFACVFIFVFFRNIPI